MKQAVGGSQPLAPYSAGIVAEGRFLFVAGQVAARDGELVTGPIEEQTELAIENLKAVLSSAGASLADVVRCGVFLADLADFGAMNDVYTRHFPDPLPARTTVQVGLPGGLKVEIDCVAVL
jgi:2-iminobutanoate/2-iminopropanoate deaminase